MSGKIPPLPSEQGGSTIGARHLWMISVPRQPETHESMRARFHALFGREPDRCYSPDESRTEFWWMGWITGDEGARLRKIEV